MIRLIGICIIGIQLFGLLEIVTVGASSLSSIGEFSHCAPLKNLDYRFVSSKTMYKHAYRLINEGKGLPVDFSNKTLREHHDKLVGESCKPVQLYMLNRHAARYPWTNEIGSMNSVLKDVQQRLLNEIDISACLTKYQPLLAWNQSMPDDENFGNDMLITGIGADETRAISQRFKSIYPQFFDTQTADVRFRTTQKARTILTGAAFLQSVNGFTISDCNLDNLPTNDVTDPKFSLSSIYSNSCYKRIKEEFWAPFLNFNFMCRSINPTWFPPRDGFDRYIATTALMKSIAAKVSKRLGLKRGLDVRATRSILSACLYETAYKGDSPWCSLFEADEIKVFDYFSDYNNYRNVEYSENANLKQTCVLFEDLMDSLMDGTKKKGSDKVKSLFNFSHSTETSKFMAALQLFKDDKNFNQKTIEARIREQKVTDTRNFRNALAIPFSANLSFILYRCEQSKTEVPDEDELDSPLANHKLLTVLNERPITILGCSSPDCELRDFFQTFGYMKDDCDLEQVCA